MVLGGQLDGVVVEHHDARLALEAGEGPGQRVFATPQGDEVHEVVGGGGLGLPHLHAPLLGQLGGVHVGHRLLTGAAEDALQHRQGEDAGVGVGELALVLHLEGGRRALGQGGEQGAEPLGERQERAHGLRRLARRHVHREGHELTGERQLDLLGDGGARLVLGLDGARAEVGRHHHARELEER